MSRSYRNVPLTVAIHHQQWMCYQLLTRPGQVVSNFLYAGDIIMSGKIMYIRIYMCVRMCVCIYILYIYIICITQDHN